MARPGGTYYNRKALILGEGDVPIIQTGRNHAAPTPRRFKDEIPFLLCASPFVIPTETARIIPPYSEISPRLFIGFKKRNSRKLEVSRSIGRGNAIRIS